jgi:mannobiose 2-epimerase
MRLSEVDMDEMKSMNTHLHLMEAYTNLLGVWPDDGLRQKLMELVEVFQNHIINPDTKQFKLFFDEYWHQKSDAVSYGHDIEGSWLLCETVDELGDKSLSDKIRCTALEIVNVTMNEGFSERYSIYAEKGEQGEIHKEVHWWQQAEAIVGLVNAYQLSGDNKYLNFAIKAWDFVIEYLVDKEFGEWYYEVDQAGKPDHSRYKVSEWKGPYHNGRACMEILKRLK